MITGQRVCLITWWAIERIQEPHPDWCGWPTTKAAADPDQRIFQEVRAGDAVGVSMSCRSNRTAITPPTLF